MDEDERTEAGTYATAEEALEAAKEIVLRSLRWEYKPGMTGDELYSNYQDFGDDPFITGPDPRPDFSAWSYAKSMCQTICEEESRKHSPPPSAP